MAREVATAYTGANVSLFIGGELLTNVFGVSWELSQGKRPIYGYNSMYFDAVATGQVIVLGQLYLNYQHPNLLSSIINKYYKDKAAGKFNDLGAITARQQEILNKIKSNIYQKSTPGNTAGNLNSDISAEMINEIFANPKLLSRVENVISSGIYGMKEVNSRNLNTDERASSDALYARPDQFSSNQALKDPLDIIITHGNPDILGDTFDKERVINYNPGSSVALRNIHFIGEAQQVMSDDQPVMEIYKFMARNKETIINNY